MADLLVNHWLVNHWLVLSVIGAGILVLVWGLPRAKHRSPYNWCSGILAVGLGLIGWSAFYAAFGYADLEMVWILVWGATFWTFAAGISQLIAQIRMLSPAS